MHHSPLLINHGTYYWTMLAKMASNAAHEHGRRGATVPFLEIGGLVVSMSENEEESVSRTLTLTHIWTFSLALDDFKYGTNNGTSGSAPRNRTLKAGCTSASSKIKQDIKDEKRKTLIKEVAEMQKGYFSSYGRW